MPDTKISALTVASSLAGTEEVGINDGTATSKRLTIAAIKAYSIPTHAATTGQTADDHHAQAHHAAHEPSGADAMAVDADAGTGSLRTLGTGATQAMPGNAGAPTLGLPRVTQLASQHSNSSTTPTKVTGLDETVESGTYTFTYTLIVRAATAGVAPQFNFNFTGDATRALWWFQYADLSSTLLAAIGTAASNVTTPTLGFGMAQAENVAATSGAATMGTTGGLQATATDTMVKITGILVVMDPGNLELWHSSETATATTVEVGSSLIVVRTA